VGKRLPVGLLVVAAFALLVAGLHRAGADIGTDPYDDCPDNSSDDAWPLDINKDRYVTVVGDVSNYSGRLGATPGNPKWWQRLDLNADGAITVVGDVGVYVDKLGDTCY